MTDAEIIKALECCLKAETGSDCEKLNCPAFTATGCIYLLASTGYDIDTMYHGLIASALDIINRQQAEIEKLQNRVICKVSFDGERLEKFKSDLVRLLEPELKAIRVDAIREFAEIINTIAKQLTEDTYNG